MTDKRITASNRFVLSAFFTLTFLLVFCGGLLFTTALSYAEENSKVTKKLEKVEKYFSKGDTDKALSLLEDLAKNFSNDPRPAMRLAKYWLDAKLFHDAIRYAENAYNIDKTNEAAKNVLCESYQGIGQMNIQLRKYEQAKEAYNKMYDLCPTDDNKNRMSFLYSKIANDCLQRKDMTCAIEAYEKILEFEPDNQQLYFELFKLYTNNGQHNEALEILKKGVAAFPNDMKLVVALGAVYFQNQQYDDAISFYEKALDKDPDNFNLAKYYAFAVQALANQKFEQLKRDDKLPRTTKPIGSAAYKKEQEKVRSELIALKQEIYQPVVQAFKKAIDLDTNKQDPKMRMNLAILYGFIGQEQDMNKLYLDTASVYKHLFEDNPSDLDALHYCAFCEFNADLLNEAESHFRQLLEIDTEHKHKTAFVYLAEILIEKKEYTESQELLNRFLRDYPDHPHINRAQQWLDYIEAVLSGTDAGQKPRKLQLTEPILDFGEEDSEGLSLDDSTGLSEDSLLDDDSVSLE